MEVLIGIVGAVVTLMVVGGAILITPRFSEPLTGTDDVSSLSQHGAEARGGAEERQRAAPTSG